MEPKGGSAALSESSSNTMRRMLALHCCLLILQDAADLCMTWCENAVLSKNHKVL